jgi:uncharacterized protein with PQ loop repeat
MLMDLVGALGWVAAAIGCVALLPQALKLFRDRDTAGISLLFWQLLLGIVTSFTVHGIAIGAPNLVVPNLAMAVISTWTMLLIGRSRGIGMIRLFGLSAALFAALGLIDATLGAAAFGIAAIIPGSVGLLGQIVDLIREPDVSGVSWGFLAMAVVMQGTWFLWGMLATEWAVRITAGVSLVLCLISMSWWIARRAGLPAMGRLPVRS